MLLNYFPINISFDNYQLFYEPYSQQKLSELRATYNSTHSFFRCGDNIYISNFEGDADITLGRMIDKSTYDDHKITSSLIKHIFFRTFKDRFPTHIPIDFYPFRFFSAQSKDDIIYEAIPQQLKNRVAYKKMIEVQLRMTQINGDQKFGFILNEKRNWVFDKNCLELYQEGYILRDLEVLHSELLPGLNNILAPNEEFVGILKEVIEDRARVLTNEGIKEYPLDELFIRKTKNNIFSYLDFAISEKQSKIIKDIIEKKPQDIFNPKKVYTEITKIAKALFTNNGQAILFKNKDGFCFTVDSKALNINNSYELSQPTFIFDYAATKTNNSADVGLTNYGPYDSPNFDIKSPNILCICHRANRGYFSTFLAELKEGLPNSKYFQKGLAKKYDLHDIHFNINEIQSYDCQEYFRAIRDNDADIKPHLAIIEIPEEFRNFDNSSNPYYQIKAKLLSQEIPVQYILTEKIKKHDEYLLNSIALQIYAKLGGTPWVLPSKQSVDKEIIIGIGHSIIRKNQFKGTPQNNIIGITTFMACDGQYLLGEKAKDATIDEYFAELLRSLQQSFKRLEKEQGWRDGDTIRLIFHVFKPINNIEFEVISEFIKGNSKYKIKFAFVTIGKSHPHLLFDPNQIGIFSTYSKEKKGEFIPRRGSNIVLDSETCIVQMFGPYELKTNKQGMSAPIQIKIRVPQRSSDNDKLNELLYYDLRYIVQQIYAFTYLSWRSFLPGDQPATMLYSNLISKLLGNMKQISGWDPDKLNYSLKRKKWFL